MKTPSLKIYAVPVALLLMAGGLAVPSASADPAPERRVVQKAFHYNPDAPAAEIYAKLRQTAKQMCTDPTPRPLSFRQLDNDCVAGAMQDGVAKIKRTDLSSFHVAQIEKGKGG
jgi:UrcA family protein